MDSDLGGWRRSPGRGKYARTELERRFLLAGVPPTARPTLLIEDRYLTGTSLRLRRVTVGEESVWKLTQKVRTDDRSPAEVATTNLYLSREEYERLLPLPATELVKSREVQVVEGTSFAVDTYLGPLAGLRLAEVEVQALDAPLPLPSWLGQEVTFDDRYSGGRLAGLTRDAAAALQPPSG